MADPAPSSEQTERFRHDLEALGGASATRFGIAVSGGPDSLALLLLAQAARTSAIEVATVDHGLRPESAGEAAFVEQLCARLGVPHATLRPIDPIEGNLQSAARRVRYALLDDWRAARGLDRILTAHHADDQAETLLMRLNRGAGVGGLSGIRPVNGCVLRPLLGWRRSELEAIVLAAGIEPVADPSNADERFDRARLRRQLAQAKWIDAQALARSAQALGEADEALEWTADRLEQERTSATATGLRIDPSGLPDELRRRLTKRMLRRIDPAADPRGEALSHLLDTLAGGGTATLAGVKCRGGTMWTFEPAPPRRPTTGSG